MNKVRAAYKRLDYNNGDFLALYQWRVMQDSVMLVWGLFQDDEDGMSENKKIVDEIKEAVSKSNDKMKFILSKRGFTAISSSKIKGSLQPEYYESKETFNYCGCDVICVLKHNFDYLKESPFIQIKRNEPVFDESTGKYVYTFYEYVVTYEGPVKTPTYKLNKEKWLKIEINSTKLYLFDAYVFGFEIPVPEIANIRKVISEIEDEEKKAQAYLDLQWVVPYQNQRLNRTINKDKIEWDKNTDGTWSLNLDNLCSAIRWGYNLKEVSRETTYVKVKDPKDPSKEIKKIDKIYSVYQAGVGDVMCNLTSFAMGLEYLGVKNPCTDKTYADCLDKIALDNGYYTAREEFKNFYGNEYTEGSAKRKSPGTRKKIASGLDVVQECMTEKPAGVAYSVFRDNVLPELKKGNAVYFSMGQHVIRLVAVFDDYMVVDDPFGCLCDGYELYRRYRLKDQSTDVVTTVNAYLNEVKELHKETYDEYRKVLKEIDEEVDELFKNKNKKDAKVKKDMKNEKQKKLIEKYPDEKYRNRLKQLDMEWKKKITYCNSKRVMQCCDHGRAYDVDCKTNPITGNGEKGKHCIWNGSDVTKVKIYNVLKLYKNE